jgi:hypothetical protein
MQKTMLKTGKKSRKKRAQNVTVLVVSILGQSDYVIVCI